MWHQERSRAVEGTNVPDAVADLTADRTVTAFLDGDRGGELILRELAQVGDVDYVAFAPPGESVEDLDRNTVFEALRGKVPYSSLADEPNLREAATDDSEVPPSTTKEGAARARCPSLPRAKPRASERATAVTTVTPVSLPAEPGARRIAGSWTRSRIRRRPRRPTRARSTRSARIARGTWKATPTPQISTTQNLTIERPTIRISTKRRMPRALKRPTPPLDNEPRSIEEHVQEIVDAGSDRARLLGDDRGVLAEIDAVDAFDAIEDAETAPHTVVVDGLIDQRLLDVAAQRGVSELLGREVGEFVKRPVGTRVLTVGDLRTGS